jgi:hypothetical protein
MKKYIETEPELQEMQVELARLAGLTENEFVKKLLNNFVNGLEEDNEDWPQNPFLFPVELANPDVTFVGPEGSDIGNLECVDISGDGELASVWFCPTFMHRWAFLVSGHIAVSFFGSPPPPIALRLDVDALGLVSEE